MKIIPPIAIFDTAVMSLNNGDTIIMNAVNRELHAIFTNRFFVNIATHDYPSVEAKKLLRQCNLAFVGGTNLLSSNLREYNQWKFRQSHFHTDLDIVLMGVGWWQYQNVIDKYSASILQKTLSKKYLHSVRDNYTKQKLASIGIDNVVNTGCPTLWEIMPHTNHSFDTDQAVFTLTDYNRNPERDMKLLEFLTEFYKRLYFWPQGSEDCSYLQTLCKLSDSHIEILSPTLESFDALLDHGESLSYIGTRLHAGIHALIKKQPVLIIGIDNRAVEMHRDFNLPVLPQKDLDMLPKILVKSYVGDVNIDLKSINRWRAQFSALKNDKGSW